MSIENEKIIPATEFRKNLFTILKKIQRPGSSRVITLDGKPSAVVMSFSEYASWKETVETASDKELSCDLLRKQESFSPSSFIPLEDILREQGFLVADSSKEKYVPRLRSKKNRNKP